MEGADKIGTWGQLVVEGRQAMQPSWHLGICYVSRVPVRKLPRPPHLGPIHVPLLYRLLDLQLLRLLLLSRGGGRRRNVAGGCEGGRREPSLASHAVL